ncbi:MAG TPA: hypothetical protein VKF17_16735 [Isosphaeraceae bacterium]|nr:hypothetical protein [Isosphaeraceae bacterium]
MNRLIPGTCYAATAGAVWGALSHDQVVAWGGAMIALGSAIVAAGLPAYHRLREARRAEDAADREAVLNDIRALTRVQVELETRIAAGAKRLDEIESQMERVRCRFPNPDGTAKCSSAQ